MVTFRKSKKIMGIRFTVSPKGVSASGGVPGYKVSANTRGEVRRTVSVPGTGIYDTKKIAGGKPPAAKTARSAPSQAPVNQESIAAVIAMVNGLSPEDQRNLYESYRDNRDETLTEIARQLTEDGGWDPASVAAVMPEFDRYMAYWLSTS